jgi:hypothetical protein
MKENVIAGVDKWKQVSAYQLSDVVRVEISRGPGLLPEQNNGRSGYSEIVISPEVGTRPGRNRRARANTFL